MNKPHEIASKASEWYIQLTSGEATESDFQAWKIWLGARPENERAWDQIKSATQPFLDVDKTLRLAALDAVYARSSSTDIRSPDRRNALKHLSVLFVIGASGALVYRFKPWQNVLADYSTAVGERREVLLQDGSKIFLNTDSLVAINYTQTHRTLTLLRGEVLVETGHETLEHYRPFRVQTPQGTVTALGTRFATRQHDGFTAVSLFEGSLDIKPEHSAGSGIRLMAGESISFGSEAVLKKSQLTSGADAWSNGYIVADKMPLADFVEELSRYRAGAIRCDPAIKDLVVSGAFPINDIDAILATLTEHLPVRIETFTRYWATIKPV